MAQARRKAHPGEVLMVRKVFKLDHEFVCSICRSIYSSYEQAHHCLESCWHRVLEMPPVITKRGKSGKVENFRCRFCGRDYGDAEEASQCARECRQKKMELSRLDAEIFRNNRPVLILRDAGFIKKPKGVKPMPVSKKTPNWKRKPAEEKTVDLPQKETSPVLTETPPTENALEPSKPDGTEEDTAEFEKIDKDEVTVA